MKKNISIFILFLLFLVGCNGNNHNNNNNDDSKNTNVNIIGQESIHQYSMDFMSFTYTPNLISRDGYCYRMDLQKATLDYSNQTINFSFSISGKEAWINEEGYSKLGKPSSIMIKGTINKETNKQQAIYLSPEDFYGKGTIDNPLIVSFDFYVPDNVFDTSEITNMLVAVQLIYYDENKDKGFTDPYFMSSGSLNFSANKNIIVEKETNVEIIEPSNTLSYEEFINQQKELYSDCKFWYENN